MLPLADIVVSLRWYVALFILGLIGWTLILERCKPLPDTGYGLGKAIGLVTVSAISWMLSVTGILPFRSYVLWLLVVIGLGYVYLKRRALLSTLRLHWKTLLISEVVFFGLFVTNLFLCAHDPMMQGIEKFMDSSILNSLLRTQKGTPLDPWYAGQPLNYYYFGQWMIATVAKLIATDGAYAFNLGFATVIASAGTSLFVAGWSVTKRWFGGIFVLFLGLFASNFSPFIAKVKHVANYSFFTSGRFVVYRINEYPLYSMTLGDIHAHVLSLILTTALFIVVILYIKDSTFMLSNAAIMGVLLGLMAATNSFDAATCSLVVVLTVLVQWYRTLQRPFYVLWRPTVHVFGGAILPLLVFLARFTQPTGGVGLASFKIPMTNILMQFGGPLILLALALMAYLRFRPRRRDASLADRIKNMDSNALLICIFGVGAVTLILIPEVIFLKDIYFYANPSYQLANTEFKVWYNAWILFAIAGGSGSILMFRYIAAARKKYILWAAGIAVAAVIGILSVGTFVGLRGVTGTEPPTINGLTYLLSTTPDEYRAVDWANKNISGQPIVLEAVGDSYSTYNWFSSYTGLPTILGWREHEWGWRYSSSEWTTISQRSAVVQSIYTSQTATALRQRVRTDDVAYILLGPDEESEYSPNTAVFTQAFGQPVLRTDTISIYRTTRS